MTNLLMGARLTSLVTWVLIVATTIGTGGLTFAFFAPESSPRITVEGGNDFAPVPQRKKQADPEGAKGESDPPAESGADEPSKDPFESTRATPASRHSGSLLYAYRCRLNDDNRLEGWLQAVDQNSGVTRPARQVTVRFFQERRFITETQVDAEGRFLVNGLVPGACAIIAGGPDGFLAFAVGILPPKSADEKVDPYEKVPEARTAIHALLAPPVDIPVIDRLMFEAFAELHRDKGDLVVPSVVFGLNLPGLNAPAGGPGAFGPASPSGPGRFGPRQGSPAPVGPQRPSGGMDQPARKPNTDPSSPEIARGLPRRTSVVSDPLPDDFAFPDGPVLRAVRPSVKEQAVKVNGEGLSIGHVVNYEGVLSDDVPSTRERVYFVVNGTIVGDTPLNRHGLFRVRGLSPRQYTMITIGPDGFAAFGVEVQRKPAEETPALPEPPIPEPPVTEPGVTAPGGTGPATTDSKPPKPETAPSSEKTGSPAVNSADPDSAVPGKAKGPAEPERREPKAPATVPPVVTTFLDLPGVSGPLHLVFLQEPEEGAAVDQPAGPDAGSSTAPPGGDGGSTTPTLGRDTVVDMEYALIDPMLLLDFLPYGQGGGGGSGFAGGAGGAGGHDPWALLGLLGLLGLIPDDDPDPASPFQVSP